MTQKTALVTGASRGLGKEMAIALAKKGIDVVITYKTKKKEAEAVQAIIQDMGRKAIVLQLDMADIASYDGFINDMVQQMQDKWGTGKIDFLVNNAGIGATIPIVNVTEEVFDNFMNIHFKGVYFLTQKLFPYLNDGGGIVNISTGTTRFRQPGYSVYSSMKSAVETFTRHLAAELGPRKIRANVVAPGPIATDFNNAFVRSNEQAQAGIIDRTPLGRLGNAEDVGGVVAFLCTEEARWVNGQRIEVAGGINM